MSSGPAEHTVGMVDGVLIEAGISFADLDALVVTVGPGSFTGTRVGIAAIRGLALATGLPVYTASSLAVIARSTLSQWQSGAACNTSAPIAVCVDARRGQIYYQLVSPDNQKALSEPQIAIAADISEAIAMINGPIWLVSSDTLDIAADCEAHGVIVEQTLNAALPSAEHLLDVDLQNADRQPKPLYLRPPDAKAQSGKAVARRP